MQRNWIRRAAFTAVMATCAVSSFGQTKGLGIPVEFTFWGGTTTVEKGGVRDTEVGLRIAELAFLPKDKTRWWLRYDNSLTLDNLDVIATGEETPHYSVGYQTEMWKGTQSLIEVGIRNLPNNVDQTIVRAEHVTFMPMNRSFKVGGWVGPREDDHTEWLAYFGYGMPVSNEIRIEPTFFYSRSGFGNDDSYRIFLPVEYSLQQGFKVSGGIAIGKASTALGNRRYVGGHVMLDAPVGNNLKAYVLVKRESVQDDISLFNVSLGLTIGLR